MKPLSAFHSQHNISHGFVEKIHLLIALFSHPEQDHIPVMRGQWFIDGSWLPLEEEESDLIEQEHLNHFRGQQIQDTFETDLIVKTVDSKDGERKYVHFCDFSEI